MTAHQSNYSAPDPSFAGRGTPEITARTRSGELHSLTIGFDTRREAEADLELLWKAISPVYGYCSDASPLSDTFTERSAGFRSYSTKSSTGKAFAFTARGHPHSEDPMPEPGVELLKKLGYID